MNAYEKAQALGLTGTPAQVVAQLKATGLTPSKIELGELMDRLNRRKMLTRLLRPTDTGEKWSGTVVDMVLAVNSIGTADQKDAVNMWFSHITGDRNNFFDTTDVSVSAPFWAMRTLFGGQENMPSIADFDAIADLGGGWLYASLSEQEYSAQKADAESDEARFALHTIADNKYEAFVERHNTAKAGIDAGTLTTEASILAVYEN